MNEQGQQDKDAVIPQCDEVKVFFNGEGGISIVQADPYSGESSCVAFPVMYSNAVCRAIRSAAKEAKGA
jgi:hypothetical protein